MRGWPRGSARLFTKHITEILSISGRKTLSLPGFRGSATNVTRPVLFMNRLLPAANENSKVNNAGEMESKKMSRFLSGVLLGAAAGLLLAPKSGRQNRALLRDKATKYSHDTAD